MKCLCATMRHANRLVSKVYEKELAAAGMTPSQFEVMTTLQAMPGVAQSDLAVKVGLDQTTLSRNVKLLVREGWVLCESSETDRRQTLYRLSDSGESAWRAALPHWRRAQKHMQQMVGSQWDQVWSSLETLMLVGDE